MSYYFKRSLINFNFILKTLCHFQNQNIASVNSCVFIWTYKNLFISEEQTACSSCNDISYVMCALLGRAHRPTTLTTNTTTVLCFCATCTESTLKISYTHTKKHVRIQTYILLEITKFHRKTNSISFTQNTRNKKKLLYNPTKGCSFVCFY